MLLNNARVLERLVTLALHGDVRLRELSPLRGRKTLVYHVFCQSLARAGSSTYVDVTLENFSFTGNYNL